MRIILKTKHKEKSRIKQYGLEWIICNEELNLILFFTISLKLPFQAA